MYFFLYMSRGAPHEGIPKNAFSTSCPEVVKLERFWMIPSITSQIFIVSMYYSGITSYV